MALAQPRGSDRCLEVTVVAGSGEALGSPTLRLVRYSGTKGSCFWFCGAGAGYQNPIPPMGIREAPLATCLRLGVANERGAEVTRVPPGKAWRASFPSSCMATSDW